MSEELIPLSYEEAIAYMVVERVHLVNGKDPYEKCHYKWNGTSVICTKYKKKRIDEYITKIPKLYLTKKEYILSEKIFEAVKFAAKKHKNQKRKGKDTPYIYHPLQVYEILKEASCHGNILIAGLLHDTLEDTKTKPNEIKKNFGQEVLDLVQAESEDKELPWKERKSYALAYLKKANNNVKLIFCADKLANLQEMYEDKLIVKEKLWDRFNASKEDIEWYYCKVPTKLVSISKYDMFRKLISFVDRVFDRSEYVHYTNWEYDFGATWEDDFIKDDEIDLLLKQG